MCQTKWSDKNYPLQEISGTLMLYHTHKEPRCPLLDKKKSQPHTHTHHTILTKVGQRQKCIPHLSNFNMIKFDSRTEQKINNSTQDSNVQNISLFHLL